MYRGIILAAVFSSACGTLSGTQRSGEPQKAQSPCGWPEGDTGNSAHVKLQVYVEPNGQARMADILEEEPPGRGFGQVAVRCALTYKHTPPNDASGSPVAGWSKPMLVNFER